jgi:hypothetical protein
MGVKGGGGMF